MKQDGYQITNDSLNENRVTDYIRQTAMSPTLKSNIKKLHNAGMLKPESKYIKGLKTGTKNIVKKFGGVIRRNDNAADMTGGAATIIPDMVSKRVNTVKAAISKNPSIVNDPDYHELLNYQKKYKQPTIVTSRHQAKKFKKISDMMSAGKGVSSIAQTERELPIIDRHEADEMRSAFRHAGKETPIMQPIMSKDVGTPKKPKKIYGPVGHHISPKVLKREKEITDYTSKAYNGLGSGLAKLRNITGEYGMVDKMKPKDIRRIEKQSAGKDFFPVSTTTGKKTRLPSMMQQAINLARKNGVDLKT